MTFPASELKFIILIDLWCLCVKHEQLWDFSLGSFHATLENGTVPQCSSNFPKKVCILGLDVKREFPTFHTLLMHPKLGFRIFHC